MSFLRWVQRLLIGKKEARGKGEKDKSWYKPSFDYIPKQTYKGKKNICKKHPIYSSNRYELIQILFLEKCI